ncbi:MAG: L,D-transpeptidase, partial [Paracoccaceae bacterium]|nr:L,D-transpeptidase [Paracoccaceae bacterium]
MSSLLAVVHPFRASALLGLVLLLAACGGKPQVAKAPPAPLPGYEAVEDGGFAIPDVNPGYTTDHNRRQSVAWNGDEAPGTIVVDPWARWLYLVED